MEVAYHPRAGYLETAREGVIRAFDIPNDNSKYRTCVLYLMHAADRLLSKGALWKIFRWFLHNPSTEIHVNLLARELGISQSSASTHLSDLHKCGLLEKKRSANALFYRLDNSSQVVRQFKQLVTAMILENLSLKERFLKEDDAIISLALYGSYASGENDEHSDLDLLVLTQSKNKDYYPLTSELGRKLEREVSLLVLSAPRWYNLKKSDPGFYESVLSRHIILYGSELP
jgi:predicted nucleotidyltransferase